MLWKPNSHFRTGTWLQECLKAIGKVQFSWERHLIWMIVTEFSTGAASTSPFSICGAREKIFTRIKDVGFPHILSAVFKWRTKNNWLNQKMCFHPFGHFQCGRDYSGVWNYQGKSQQTGWPTSCLFQQGSWWCPRRPIGRTYLINAESGIKCCSARGNVTINPFLPIQQEERKKECPILKISF